MSSPNLLITGATGFIGFHVLLSALEQGYSVRAAVRSISQSETLASHPKIKSLALPDMLSFVEVPDICREHAYDEAVKGVSYIIHHASPLPSPFLDPQTGIYEPNIKGVTTMLHSALEEKSVKKLVITSSVFANIPFPPDPTEEITAESRLPDLPGPFDSMLPAYSAGKIGALNATEKFVKDNRPAFDIVNVLPGFVFGWDDRALTVQDITSGTNRVLLPIITGQSTHNPMPAGAAHVSDVAKVHMLALREGVTGSIGVTSVNAFDDAWEIVKKKFPEAVAEGVFTQGHQPTIPVNWNAHKTEVEFGFKFKTFEDMVTDVASQYLELSGKEKA
ncbi:putative cinnamoyl-CoA reductase [Camillea tinctor]|nr:putative cinnamoyl-CoA reductase [Camillea tinctor]